ncbi:MAG: hypothetical protein WBO10_17015 [Pyrinomonadaceae bacterium]
MYNTTGEVVGLVKAFEERTLTKAEWNHAAHLTVGLYYCIRFSFGLATNMLRNGIRALNDAHGVPNTKTSGYHETITVFWMITINQFVETCTYYNLARLANEIVSTFDDPRLPFDYYSSERLFSPEAREHHIQPDLDDYYLIVNSAKVAARVGGGKKPIFT